jgi:hypothetical protein
MPIVVGKPLTQSSLAIRPTKRCRCRIISRMIDSIMAAKYTLSPIRTAQTPQ